MPSAPLYIGRFAPSPTGPLHLGSLYTAFASFLSARANCGQWLLRIDDLDTPRNLAGSADSILKTLQTFGLQWDGAVDYQSAHHEEYQQALEKLIARDLVYPCACSRKRLAESGASGIYPGTCRNQRLPTTEPYALRIKTHHQPITFTDYLQGSICQDIATQQGDFVLKRKDGIFAYQLAVVVDDARQHITHVVRGMDLLSETPKQIYLQHLLGISTPCYRHVPIIVDQHGQKLSKQSLAKPVDLANPQHTLYTLLQYLKQNPPSTLKNGSLSELLNWAIDHWHIEALQGIITLPLP